MATVITTVPLLATLTLCAALVLPMAVAASVRALGVILAAAYVLWMVQRVLYGEVTNPKGPAAGDKALAQYVEARGFTVVAPDLNQSAVGHTKTLMRPLRVRERTLADGSTGYSVDGSPTDCVSLSFLGFFEERSHRVVPAAGCLQVRRQRVEVDLEQLDRGLGLAAGADALLENFAQLDQVRRRRGMARQPAQLVLGRGGE